MLSRTHTHKKQLEEEEKSDFEYLVRSRRRRSIRNDRDYVAKEGEIKGGNTNKFIIGGTFCGAPATTASAGANKIRNYCAVSFNFSALLI